jgi:hypothetical protein
MQKIVIGDTNKMIQDAEESTVQWRPEGLIKRLYLVVFVFLFNWFTPLRSSVLWFRVVIPSPSWSRCDRGSERTICQPLELLIWGWSQ